MYYDMAMKPEAKRLAKEQKKAEKAIRKATKKEQKHNAKLVKRLEKGSRACERQARLVIWIHTKADAIYGYLLRKTDEKLDKIRDRVIKLDTKVEKLIAARRVEAQCLHIELDYITRDKAKCEAKAAELRAVLDKE